MASPFGAVTLNGSDQYIQVPHAADIDFGRENMSVHVFFRSSLSGPIARKHDGTRGWQINLSATGAVEVVVNGTTITSAATSYDDGQWHYVEFGVDQDSGRIYLLVDTSFTNASFVSSTLTNTADLLLGTDLSAFHACDISELRVSSRLRHVAPLDAVPAVQHSDDPWTHCLLNFNEGHDSVIHDSSASVSSEAQTPTHNDGTFVGFASDSSWTNGPLLAPPAMIMRAAVWYALDTYSPLTRFATENRLRRFRGRDGDADAQRAPEPTVSNAPYLFVHPGPIPNQDFATSSYNEFNMPITIVGWLHYGSQDGISTLSYLASKALWTMFGFQSLVFWHNHVEDLNIVNSGVTIARVDTEFFQGFEMTAVFRMRRDFLSTSQP